MGSSSKAPPGLLQQLEACPCDQHLQACTAALRAAAGSKAWGTMLATLTARPSRELQQENADVFDALLRLCTAAFDISRGSAGGGAAAAGSGGAVTEEHVLQLYSYVKRLVGLGCLRAALAHGWALLADLDAAAVARPDGSDSRALQDVRSAACLNVIICTCEAAEPVLASLDRVNAAAGRLLAGLRWVCVLGEQRQRALARGCTCHMLLKHTGRKNPALRGPRLLVCRVWLHAGGSQRRQRPSRLLC